MIEKETLAGSERSNPTRAWSRSPSALGENCFGLAAKRITNGTSLLSCCVAKNAAMVATTSRANTARTTGRAMGSGKLVLRAAARMRRVRVQLIDPSADVLPYDHALATALARRGLDVDLVTSRFVHGPAPLPDGYAVNETFYRLATRLGRRRPRLRRALKGMGHVPGMVRAARRPAALSHWQWIWLEAHQRPRFCLAGARRC